MTAVVVINKSVLFETVMAALEAYAIKHDRQKVIAIETAAHLWGSINRQLPFKCKIEHVSVETSAKRARGSVRWNPYSLDLKKDIASAFGDGFSYIGSFHTHPWLKNESYGYKKIDGPESIRKDKLFDFSSSDHKCEINSPQITIGKNKFSVALVMTVYSMERANDQKDGDIDSNIKEFSLGNVKFWLQARVFEHKLFNQCSEGELSAFESYGLNVNNFKSTDLLPIPVDTVMECKALTDLDLYLKEFGRLTAEESGSEYLNSSKAETRWFAR
jgi:hypothetical protein